MITDIIFELIRNACASGILYLIGILFIHPKSFIVSFFEYKGYSYDLILSKGHKISLVLWFIGFNIITYITFI